MSFSFEIRNLGDEFGMNLAAVGVGGELAEMSAIAVVRGFGCQRAFTG
jgi:hypothetical protein